MTQQVWVDHTCEDPFHMIYRFLVVDVAKLRELQRMENGHIDYLVINNHYSNYIDLDGFDYKPFKLLII